MNFSIRGDKFEVTDAIRDYIESKLGKLDKYFKEETTANVVIKTRGKKDVIEVTIPTKDVVLRAEEEHDDLYAGIDLVSDKLERMIRKNKTKLKKKETDLQTQKANDNTAAEIAKNALSEYEELMRSDILDALLKEKLSRCKTSVCQGDQPLFDH